MSPDFLSPDEVREIHTMQLKRFGGGAGLRDEGLLESALAQPAASFGGQLVHEDVWAMAAAYLFHVVSNHPFVDGNKRAGLLAALVFLDLNGISLEHGSEALYELTMAVAEGRETKARVAAELRRIAHGR
ncbi:type II toxin-antitoxin system death-on-curing family toxin [Hyalangium versicolor]|uniref:type II toxin-antitoxin system death-on-curing family toxin n=1 Tax=Hyalangium versicolor TaxID=2861190 RepID=UPI001CCA1E0E|nr:type II toxin-antitoxin system death-on-curing family toxin [Hyalangium versicolor]